MIPSREEAISVAVENAAIDAAKYERIIESALMIWDGKTEIRLDIPGTEANTVPHLTRKLKEAGYVVRAVERSNAAKDWWLYFR